MALTGYPDDVSERLRADAEEIISRYPQPRSALLPMLHLVQSHDGYVSANGIALCADVLGLSRAEVSAVATFYTQYKRHPNGDYTVGVCTNALCAVMGGDTIYERLSEHLGIGHDETTEDGRLTLERVECNAACDYAPVVMVNWEFFDNATPASAIEIADKLRAGEEVSPTRGAATVATFTEVSRVLAGFEDGRVDEGVAAGPATLEGLRIAREKGWQAPELPEADGHLETDAASEPISTDAGIRRSGTEPVGKKASSAERKPEAPQDVEAETVAKADGATADEAGEGDEE